uniref:Uncharacterized protein n=1 Tax=Rhizophora mucronata TaxID=61149 RepID=A0A2P2P3W2_RHIMU
MHACTCMHTRTNTNTKEKKKKGTKLLAKNIKFRSLSPANYSYRLVYFEFPQQIRQYLQK